MEPTTTTSPTIEELQKENAELKAKLTWLEEQLRLSQQKRFSTSSERTNEDLELFNEVEAEVDPSLQEPTVETIQYTRKKKRGQREAMIENLPVETVE